MSGGMRSNAGRTLLKVPSYVLESHDVVTGVEPVNSGTEAKLMSNSV